MDGACLELAGKMPAESSTLAETDERSLVVRAQHGDRGAFDALVCRYDREVLRLTMKVTRSTDEAADLYQEAFLKAFRSLRHFRFESSFYTWIYRVATNVCLDHLRRQKRRNEVQAPATNPDEPEYLQVVPDVKASNDPERATHSREINRRIHTAMEALSPRERMVFELRHYEGLKLRKIGEMVGTTEETAKNCLFRATQKLRLALGDLM